MRGRRARDKSQIVFLVEIEIIIISIQMVSGKFTKTPSNILTVKFKNVPPTDHT